MADIININSVAEAEAIVKKYPYFLDPLIRTLHDTEGETRERYCRRITAGVDSTMALRKIFGTESTDLQQFYPPASPELVSTDDTISKFMDKFGPKSSLHPDNGEDIPENVPIAPPTIDYTEIIAETTSPSDNISEDETSNAIDSFLNTVPPARPKKLAKISATEIMEDTSTEKEEKNEQSTLTESFARILIKNGNYEKALSIINELSLKNPKKNIYFADQIRFLKKLIANREGKSSSGSEKA